MRCSVNEYTRREEVRWILVSAVVLVSSVAVALGSMLTARGPVVPDPQAKANAEAAEAELKEIAPCADQARALEKEARLFREDAKVLEQPPVQEEPAPEPPPPPKGRPLPKRPGAPKEEKPKPPKPKPVDMSAQAWPAAKPTFEEATRLAPCRALAEALLPPDAKAKEGWDAVASVVTLKAPADSEPVAAHLTTARRVFAAMEKAPLDAVVTHVVDATASQSARVDEARARAASAKVQLPLRKGVLGREPAIAAGVLVSLVALLVSFFSLRATSARRAAAVTPYRKAVKPPERGLQAATILRLASEPNGGEPGIVLGAALGGLAASLVARADADWYVAGVAAGLVLGLLVQTVVKGVGTTKHFRDRALAIAEIEKPAVPIVLVLSSVQKGTEDDFLGFFLKLSPTEAANAVEKLATQAEEQILIAADAQAQR